MWKARRRTFGCTTIGNESGRPDVHLLSRAGVGRLRLDGDTVAFTQHARGTPERARRVTAIDLRSGQRFLDRRKAIPRGSAGAGRELEAPVAGLRVLRGGYVGWIARGSTVVIGAQEPDDVGIVGLPEATGWISLYGSPGYAGVAAFHPPSAEGARNLVRSLRIVEADPDPDPLPDGQTAEEGSGDDGRYRVVWSWSLDGATRIEAEMTGFRD